MDIKEDGRRLSREAQHERRKQAIRLHRKGMKAVDIAAALSMSPVTVYTAIKVVETGGLRALVPKPTGRKVGQMRQLTPEQELHIQRLICEKRPEQLKMQFALWTRAAVMQLVESEYGISLPVRTMGEYLKRWGFTPQRPVVRAYEQRPESVKQWLEHEYRSRHAPKKRTQKFIGATRPPWSTPMCVGVAISQKVKHQSPWPLAVPVTSSR